MWSKLGIYSILASGIIGLFSGISKFMGIDNFFVGLTLSRVVGDAAESLAGAIPFEWAKEPLNYLVYDLPLAWLIVGLAVIFFMAGAILGER